MMMISLINQFGWLWMDQRMGRLEVDMYTHSMMIHLFWWPTYPTYIFKLFLCTYKHYIIYLHTSSSWSEQRTTKRRGKAGGGGGGSASSSYIPTYIYTDVDDTWWIGECMALLSMHLSFYLFFYDYWCMYVRRGWMDGWIRPRKEERHWDERERGRGRMMMMRGGVFSLFV